MPCRIPPAPVPFPGVPFLRMLVLAMATALPGCHRFTKEGADEEVYGILARTRPAVPEVAGTLDIEAGAGRAAQERQRGTFRLTLADALRLATTASREVRSRREDVYLAALALTSAINEFRPQAALGGSADLVGDADGAAFEGSVDATLSRALENGGSVVIGLAQNFLRSLSDNPGDPLRAAQSILTADVLLPLLRGGGRLVARENLVQSEHDLLYALRAYARFQQEFTVRVAESFYRALQSRDTWRNAVAAQESLKLLVDQQRLMAEFRIASFQVDQAEQRLLETEDDGQRARARFEAALDRFKLDLGIPVTAEIVLEDSDLEALRGRGPRGVDFALDEAVRLAHAERLDLRTAQDGVADARRHVVVARDALGTGLDLRAGGEVSTPSDRPFDLDDALTSGNVGIDLDLPLERTAERNALRRTIIDAERARREAERAEDEVALEVREAFRVLAQARRSHEIQAEGVRLAERRVESTELLLDRDAEIRDRLDAEDARIRARDALTAALVDHELARLALERDVGVLRVDAAGLPVERRTTTRKPAAPPRAAARGGDLPVRPAGGTEAPTPPGPGPEARPPPDALPPPAIVPRGPGTVGAR